MQFGRAELLMISIFSRNLQLRFSLKSGGFCVVAFIMIASAIQCHAFSRIQAEWFSRCNSATCERISLAACVKLAREKANNNKKNCQSLHRYTYALTHSIMHVEWCNQRKHFDLFGTLIESFAVGRKRQGGIQRKTRIKISNCNEI